MNVLTGVDRGTEHSTIDRSTIDRLAGVHGGPSLVFVNGVFDAALSDIDPPLSGVWLGDAMGADPSDVFYAADDEPAADGAGLAAVFVEADVSVLEPIQIVHLRDPGAPGAAEARTAVHLGRASSAQVIEAYVSIGGPADTETGTRIVVEADAELSLQRFVRAEADSDHVDRTVVRQEAGSTVRSTSVLLDGNHVESNFEVTLAGPGARLDAQGLHAPTGRQRHEHLLVVDHAAPDCTSSQRFMGIVDQAGHGVFASHVIVRPGAARTDSVQSNPNLVLSATAQADTRPWLEILDDDVTCKHGATVGRLDEDALFYLRSRGVPEAEARALLVEAFASDVLSSVRPESLRDLLVAGLDRSWTGAIL